MSWTIPPQVEQDLIAGRATFQTHQIGYGGQSVLVVPTNSYIVIFGYDFSPAGGGLANYQFYDDSQEVYLCPLKLRAFGTQQISIYTGSDFYPFVHSVPLLQNVYSYTGPVETDERFMWSVDTAPISRPLYITSSRNVAISVGLIIQGNQIQFNQTPVTSNTPPALTYGGSGFNNNAELALNGGNTRNFIQPNLPTDIYGFTPLTANNGDQLYWFPDGVYGMFDPMQWLQNNFDPFIDDTSNQAAANYKLCLHYALYNATIPETRG